MAAPVFPEIDSSGVTAMRLAYGPGKAGFGLRHSNKVNMVWHETPSPYCNIVFAAPLAHQIDIGEIIIITEKNRLSPIPPLGNMVRYARIYNSCYSCHGKNIADVNRLVKFNILSPELPSGTPGTPRNSELGTVPRTRSRNSNTCHAFFSLFYPSHVLSLKQEVDYERKNKRFVT